MFFICLIIVARTTKTGLMEHGSQRKIQPFQITGPHFLYFQWIMNITPEQLKLSQYLNNQIQTMVTWKYYELWRTFMKKYGIFAVLAGCSVIIFKHNFSSEQSIAVFASLTFYLWLIWEKFVQVIDGYFIAKLVLTLVFLSLLYLSALSLHWLVPEILWTLDEWQREWYFWTRVIILKESVELFIASIDLCIFLKKKSKKLNTLQLQLELIYYKINCMWDVLIKYFDEDEINEIMGFLYANLEGKNVWKNVINHNTDAQLANDVLYHNLHLMPQLLEHILFETNVTMNLQMGTNTKKKKNKKRTKMYNICF